MSRFWKHFPAVALYAAGESESFVSMHYVDSIKMARAGGEMMIARIPVGLCFLCSLFQKQACIRKTDTKSTRTICAFFCAQHPHGCFWGEKQTDCFHVCSKKLLQHVGFDCCNCGLLWQLASGHNGARTPHGGTNLCFHGIFKDSLSSYSQHQTAIDHLVTIKLNALPLLKCGLFKMYPSFYNCDSLHSTGLKC